MAVRFGFKRWGETPGEPVQAQKPGSSGSRGRSPHQRKSENTVINETLLPVRDYDLAATLDSGQAFRWQPDNGSWTGVIGWHRVCLTQTPDGIRAETAGPVANWQWLRVYLQTGLDLDAVLKTFPDDAPMRAAVAACRGLRLLRQDPWECLASFILSSTKQIVQIRQIVSLLCERFGEPITRPEATWERRRLAGPQHPDKPVHSPAGRQRSQITLGPPDGAMGTLLSKENHLFHSFPSAERLAAVTEADLRACKMGFRAPHLLAAARRVTEGQLDLERLRHLPLAEARHQLTALRGVGGKIADCVLLFALGFDGAFPVDVWVERALRELYFPRRRVSDKRLRHFAATHFGPHAGYAQQYLFHYMRTKRK
ncbi:MAG: DNA-3-methyladenine glycosylase family protein [Limisphaerales bacterium]